MKSYEELRKLNREVRTTHRDYTPEQRAAAGARLKEARENAKIKRELEKQKEPIIMETQETTTVQPSSQVLPVQNTQASKEEDKVIKEVIHSTAEESSIGALVRMVEDEWDEKSLKQAITDMQTLYVDPRWILLHEIRDLHPDFNYRYRFINTEKERVSHAIQVEKWKPVNRTNHPKLNPKRIHDSYGCVELEDQLLMWRPKSFDDAWNLKGRQKHNDRVSELEDKAKSDPRFYLPQGKGIPGAEAWELDEDTKEFIPTTMTE